jgi:hypothetical protein
MIPPEGRTEEQAPIFQTEEGIEFAFFTFVVDELPYLFPETFVFDSCANPVLKRAVNIPPHEAFQLYFGLTPKEFLHIACPNSQQKEWGGIQLPYHAVPQDVGYQIFELVALYTRMN